jgi:hypothetical protein
MVPLCQQAWVGVCSAGTEPGRQRSICKVLVVEKPALLHEGLLSDVNRVAFSVPRQHTSWTFSSTFTLLCYVRWRFNAEGTEAVRAAQNSFGFSAAWSTSPAAGCRPKLATCEVVDECRGRYGLACLIRINVVCLILLPSTHIFLTPASE